MIARLFPTTKDLLTYNRSTLYSDLIAGLSIAVIVIPQGLAYAMIAGLPPIYGLYAALVPQFIHGIMGTSRHPAVGPVALDSLVVRCHCLGSFVFERNWGGGCCCNIFSNNGKLKKRLPH